MSSFQLPQWSVHTYPAGGSAAVLQTLRSIKHEFIFPDYFYLFISLFLSVSHDQSGVQTSAGKKWERKLQQY